MSNCGIEPSKLGILLTKGKSRKLTQLKCEPWVLKAVKSLTPSLLWTLYTTINVNYQDSTKIQLRAVNVKEQTPVPNSLKLNHEIVSIIFQKKKSHRNCTPYPQCRLMCRASIDSLHMNKAESYQNQSPQTRAVVYCTQTSIGIKCKQG